jgi:hypothetical protein
MNKHALYFLAATAAGVFLGGSLAGIVGFSQIYQGGYSVGSSI